MTAQVINKIADNIDEAYPPGDSIPMMRTREELYRIAMLLARIFHYHGF